MDFPSGQWLRIHPKQKTWVHSRSREDHTCHEAAKAMRHNYQAGVLETMLCNKKSHHSWKPHALQLET